MEAFNVLPVLEHLRVVLYLDFASAVIVLYDYILTLDLETHYMWYKQRWSLIRILFFINRYMPFVDITFSLYNELVPTDQGCAFMNRFTGLSFCLSIALSEVLTMRTWSLWKARRWSGIALVVFYLSCWIPIVVIVGLFVADASAHGLRLPGYTTCIFIPDNKNLYICWILLLVYDTGTLASMVLAGTKSCTQLYGRSGGSSALLHTLYRDGITYYIALFILSLMNIITVAMLPDEFVNLFSVLQRAIHSTLTSRVILHLREQAEGRAIYSDSLIFTYHSTEAS